jgi:hypothetical protein
LKRALVVLSGLLLVAGCGQKKEAPKAAVAPEPAHAAAPSAEAVAGKPAPADALHGAAAKDPHASIERVAINAGTGRKGTVKETMNAAGYTYIQVDEKGTPVWLAVMETQVKKGDVVEFPDSPPTNNFHSKTLNRTFEAILFVPGVRVERK